jgi:hypothetical protein
MKPHFNEYIQVFRNYKDAKKEFYVIHLSDEYANDPIDWYEWATHVYRPYVRNIPGNNITYLPLGPYRTTKKINDLRNRKLIWSFFGTGWNNRADKINDLKIIGPNECRLFDSWADSNQVNSETYSEICLNSIFMPCPGGQNVETFRFYEALEHGVIPLYVRQGEDDTHFKFLANYLPLPIIDSWDNVKNVIVTFLQKPEELIAYRNKLFEAWGIWKEEIKANVKYI